MNFQVLFDRPHPLYLAGETITGTIQFSSKKIKNDTQQKESEEMKKKALALSSRCLLHSRAPLNVGGRSQRQRIMEASVPLSTILPDKYSSFNKDQHLHSPQHLR
jgi:hypothetical protein